MLLPQKAYLGLEFLGLFIGLPLGLRACFPGRFLLPLLWLGAGICLAWLWRNAAFKRSELWSVSGQQQCLLRILTRFALAALLIGLAIACWVPGRLFHLIQDRPEVWLLIMVLYPLLSVYPQGIVYRSFIFHRYGKLFATPLAMTLASALAFAMVHWVFGNLPALGLTLIGGIMFAQTYRRTQSLMISSLEHALYGCFMFTIGLGDFFYHGR